MKIFQQVFSCASTAETLNMMSKVMVLIKLNKSQQRLLKQLHVKVMTQTDKLSVWLLLSLYMKFCTCRSLHACVWAVLKTHQRQKLKIFSLLQQAHMSWESTKQKVDIKTWWWLFPHVQGFWENGRQFIPCLCFFRFLSSGDYLTHTNSTL